MRCCAVPKGTEESQSRRTQCFRAGLITFAPEGAYAVPKGTRNLVTTLTQHSAPKEGAPCWAKLCRACGTVLRQSRALYQQTTPGRLSAVMPCMRHSFPFASSTTSDDELLHVLPKSDRPSTSGGNQPMKSDLRIGRQAIPLAKSERRRASLKKPPALDQRAG